MNNKEYVYLELLKITIAGILLEIDKESNTDSNIMEFANFNVAIALKTITNITELGLYLEDKSKEDSIKQVKELYFKNFTNTKDLAKYMEYFKEYTALEDNLQLIICSILYLPTFINEKSKNKQKNILNNYIKHLKRVSKNSDKLYTALNPRQDILKFKFLVFTFLVQNA